MYELGKIKVGTPISDEDDFKRVTVFKRDEGNGPVYSIAFKHKEEWGGNHTGLVFLLTVSPTVLTILSLWFFGFTPELVIYMWVLPTILTIIIAFMSPSYKTVIRIIELDVGEQRFRVFENGKIDFDRKLTPFKITVEDHPDLEWERENRRQHKQTGPGELEKLHGLVGWFGAEQQERNDLFFRPEWPKRYSLREVQAAILWTVKIMASGGTKHSVSTADEDEAQVQSIAPPLD